METLKIEITKEILERYVPAFETPDNNIFERLGTFFEIAKGELSQLMGDNAATYLQECPELLTKIEDFVCTEAAFLAIPQLDLVLTETGFGVVSTNQVAPASKDRVVTLSEELRQHASDILDVIVMFLLKYSSWKDSEEAKSYVFSLLYSPAQFRNRWQWKGKAIYREEFAQLRPKIELAAAHVQKIISKELYDELLVRLRSGKNEAAYELTASRATNYMLAFLDDQPLSEFKRILINTIEALADNLPQYQGSSVYRARHSSGYENRKEDPVFFMS